MLSYPKTYHIEGSKGFTGPDHVLLSDVQGSLVIEEKLDGSEVSLFFQDGQPVVRHRNNTVNGLPEFSPFWDWLYARIQPLQVALGENFILFGEWMYGLHTVFYNRLPSYFFAYDIYDLEGSRWVTESHRLHILKDVDVKHVPVLYRGPVFDSVESLRSLTAYSCVYKSDNWRDVLAEHAGYLDYVWDSNHAEGLYIKSESERETTGFYKWIRPEFLEAIQASGTHWKDRPLVTNLLS